MKGIIFVVVTAVILFNLVTVYAALSVASYWDDIEGGQDESTEA